MFHYIFSVHRKPNTDTSDYQGLGTPDPHPNGHSLFKLGQTEVASVDFTHRFELEVHGSKVRSSEGFGPSSDVVGAATLANPGADCITGKTKLASLLKQGPKRGIPDNTAENT